MGVRRRFSAGFRRQVVEELLDGAATMARLCRRYELHPTVMGNWKERYTKGHLAEPEQVGQGQEERIRELERKVGQLIMGNARARSAVAYTLQRRSEASSFLNGPRSALSRGDVS